MKTNSGVYGIAKEASGFALNMLGKAKQVLAFGFFKPATVEGNKVSGEPFHAGSTGAPILDNANVTKQPEGRADEAILEMKELGDAVFYGG